MPSVGEQALSVIVPAYNEEHAVAGVVEEIRRVLNAAGCAFEVVVVDDGSTDRTEARARGAGAEVVRHPENRGYGAALKTGIRHARHPWLCITDADGTYPNARIPDLLAHAVEHGADMVVGSRTGAHVAIPLVRRPAKWAITRLASMVAGEGIPDLNSGLRVTRRPALLPFFSLLPDGFSFTTTITLAMLSNGYSVAYVPVDYHHRVGRSKIRPIRDTLNFVQLILRIALYFAPLKVFLPLSATLALLAVAWGAFTKLVTGTVADVSTVVIVMSAVQVGVVGLLAELINRRLPSHFKQER